MHSPCVTCIHIVCWHTMYMLYAIQCTVWPHWHTAYMWAAALCRTALSSHCSSSNSNTKHVGIIVLLFLASTVSHPTQQLCQVECREWLQLAALQVFCGQRSCLTDPSRTLECVQPQHPVALYKTKQESYGQYRYVLPWLQDPKPVVMHHLDFPGNTHNTIMSGSITCHVL